MNYNRIAKLILFLILIVICALLACSDDDSDDQSSHTPDTDDDDDDNDDEDNGEGEPLARDDFSLMIDGGVDDRINSYPWAVALFDGDKDGVEEIYVGTIANALCLQVPMASILFDLFPDARPPLSWQCGDQFWNPDNWTLYYLDNIGKAVVFRGTLSKDGKGWNWERVFEPSMTQSAGFRGSIVFKDALYMLGASRKGGMIYKTVDGKNWEPASQLGVMAEHAGYNKFLRGAVVFKDKLYVANSAPTSSYIYASANPAPGNWELVNSNGFSDSGGPLQEEVYETGTSTGANFLKTLTDKNKSLIPFYYGGEVYLLRITNGTGAGQVRVICENTGNTIFVTEPWDQVPDQSSEYEIFRSDAPINGPIYQMAVFNEKLYAAPFNYTTGAELWCSADPAPGNWTRVIEGGFHKPNVEGFMTVTSFKDYIYLGTVAYPGYFDDIEDLLGCEILRIDKDNNVELLVGQTRYSGEPNEIKPLSGYGSGFDYAPNVYIWNGIEYDGWLYMATFDAGGLGLDFMTEMFPEGFSDDLMSILESIYGGDHSKWGGFDFWRTENGVDWEPISLDGFENLHNFGIRSFAKTPWGLLVGAANPYDGFELWLGQKEK